MFNKLLSKIRTYFYYKKTERNGIIALMFLLLLFFGGLYFYEDFVSSDKEIDSFYRQIDSLESVTKIEAIPAIAYFVFNPNLVEEADLKKLGFSQRQIKMLLNYRKAGGKFYKKEDFKKLYFVTDSLYKIYKPYLLIEKKLATNKTHNKKKKSNTKSKHVEQVKKEITYYDFDPNLLTKQQWIDFGVSQRVATTIQNYLLKGGKFYKKEDLKKIYGLSEEKYNELAPFIVIAKKKKETKVEKQKVIYDLNTVTKEELLELYVSLSMANKVVKYREKLGGYAEMSQLLELYNIKERDLKLLQKHCNIVSKVKQININTADSKQLKAHPYLDFHDAEAIIRYRKRKGKYKSIEVLKSRKILTETTFERVKFYLKVKD